MQLSRMFYKGRVVKKKEKSASRTLYSIYLFISLKF